MACPRKTRVALTHFQMHMLCEGFLFLSSAAGVLTAGSAFRVHLFSCLGLGKHPFWLMDVFSACCKASVASCPYLGQEYQYPFATKTHSHGPTPPIPTPTATLALETPGRRKRPLLCHICLIPTQPPPCEQDGGHTPPQGPVHPHRKPLSFLVSPVYVGDVQVRALRSGLESPYLGEHFQNETISHCVPLFFFNFHKPSLNTLTFLIEKSSVSYYNKLYSKQLDVRSQGILGDALNSSC